MTNDVRERPKLDLGADDDLDLSDFGVDETAPIKPEPTPAEVEKVSESAGFPSRSSAAKHTLRRKRRKTSPFQVPLGIKTRSGMKELFQELGDLLDTHDHTTFERAIEALIKEKGDKALMQRFKRLTEAE